ncbi:MAG: nitroreductase [Acidimicrobiia bacterium]|nr:nitroreductase [Acidimicrobiia bacterium]
MTEEQLSPAQPEESIDALTALATTRTIRRYTSDPIPKEDLGRILWHATRAPSGSNRQPVRYLVLTDGRKATEAKHLLGEAFRRGWSAKVRGDGYDSGSGLDPASPKARQARAMQEYVDNFERIPVVVLVCLVRYREPNPYEGASVYPACQNLLLAARALGYGGALTMWHQGVDEELHQLLEIPDDVALSACITLGRPRGGHGPVRRRPLKDVVFDDTWGEKTSWVDDPDGTRYASGGPT